MLDAIALFGIFGAYLWQVGQPPKGEKEEGNEEKPGPGAALSTLCPKAQWAWMAGLSMVAATVIYISAEPFAESIVASGRIVGIDEFLLIQWVAPLASEAPAIVIAVLCILSGRAAGGMKAMISDKMLLWLSWLFCFRQVSVSMRVSLELGKFVLLLMAATTMAANIFRHSSFSGGQVLQYPAIFSGFWCLAKFA